MRELKDKEQFYNYLIKQGRSEATASSYVSTLKTFEEGGYSYDFNSVCRWKEEMLDKCKPASINLKINAMNQFLTYNKFRFKLKPLKVHLQHFVEDQLTMGQYKKLLKGLLDDNEIQYYVAVKILANTGVRISEFMQIELSHIRQGYIDVLGKGDKFRRIWFPESLVEEVLSIYDVEGPIVPYSDRYIREKLHRFADKYDIPREILHPHEFRSFFARNVYDKTKDIRLLQDLLGHANVATTMRYLRKTSDDMGKKISHIVNW